MEKKTKHIFRNNFFVIHKENKVMQVNYDRILNELSI